MGSVEGFLVRDPVATFRADGMCIEGFAGNRKGDRIGSVVRSSDIFPGRGSSLSFGVLGGGWERGSR